MKHIKVIAIAILILSGCQRDRPQANVDSDLAELCGEDASMNKFGGISKST